jgi:O-antigen/teichoic acid export membrane protein
MNPAVSIRRNSFWLAFARFSAQALNVLFAALAARRLGAAGFGHFSFLTALVLLGNTFTTFGTDTLLIRELARTGKTTDLLPRAFSLQITLSVLWIGVTLLIEPRSLLLLYSLSLFPLALSSVASAVFRGFERMDLYWQTTLLASLTQLIAVFLAWDLSSLCVFLMIGHLAAALISLALCSASFPTFSLFPLLDFRPIFSLALPFALLTTISLLSQRLGLFSVSSLLGEREAGYYSAAARVVEGLKLGHYAVLGALLPALSRAAQNTNPKLRVAFTAMLGLSALLSAAVTLAAQPLVTLLYGSGYTPSIALLTILAWTLVPYTVSAFISVDLVSGGHEQTLVKTAIVSLGIFLALYFGLISVFGSNGAACAALVGEILQAVVLVIARRRSRFA